MKHSKFLSLIFILFMGCFVFAHNAYALAPKTITYTWFGLFVVFFILIIFPLSIIAMILRLLGFNKIGQGSGWIWHVKQSLVQFLKMFLYNTGFFGLWFLIVRYVSGSRWTEAFGSFTLDHLPSYAYNLGFDSRFLDIIFGTFEMFEVFINGYEIIFVIYAFMYAFLTQILFYNWRKWRAKSVNKTSIWVYLRLFIWNILIFLSIGLILRVISLFLDR